MPRKPPRPTARHQANNARLAATLRHDPGASPTAALKRYRAEGGAGIRTQTFYRLWKQAELEGVTPGVTPELDRPKNRRPTESERKQMETRNATGVMQRVRVMGTDKHGRIQIRDISIRSRKGISRGNAEAQAITITSKSKKDRYEGFRPLAAYEFEALTLTPR